VVTEFVNVKKLTPDVDNPDFLFYICVMDNLKQLIINRKYDILCLCSLILMLSVCVLFAIPAMVFLVYGESKKEL
jgi:hypothetical protein